MPNSASVRGATAGHSPQVRQQWGSPHPAPVAGGDGGGGATLAAAVAGGYIVDNVVGNNVQIAAAFGANGSPLQSSLTTGR